MRPFPFFGGMKAALILFITLLLIACSSDPCWNADGLPSCDTAKAVSKATITALDNRQAAEHRSADMRATQDAIALQAQATQGAINSLATEQAVKAAATQGALDRRATDVAQRAQATAQVIALDATRTSVKAAATRTALDTQGLIDQAQVQSASAGPLEAFKITMLIAASLFGLLLAKKTAEAVSAFAARTMNKRAAIVHYGPAVAPQMALVVYDDRHQPIKIWTQDREIEPLADLTADNTAWWKQLDVPDALKLALLADVAKRHQAARIAVATGAPPWGTSTDSFTTAAPLSAFPGQPAPQPAGTTPVESAWKVVPSFRDLLADWKPTSQQMLFGISPAQGPIYGPIERLLSVMIVGRQGTGKTTLLRLIYAQCLLVGARVILWDRHSDIIDDLPGVEALTTADQIRASTADVLKVLDTRIHRQLKHNAQPLMVLIDEINSLSFDVPEVIDAVSRIVMEGRKYNVYCTVSAKGAPADEFGKSYIRDAFSAHYAFQTTTKQAALIGFDRDDVPKVRDLQVGQALFDGVFPAQVVGIPNITAPDVRALLPAGVPASTASATSGQPIGSGEEMLFPATSAASTREVVDHGEAEAILLTPGSEDIALQELIRRLIKEGVQPRKIIKQVWHVDGGRNYTIAAKELARITAQLVEQR